jgi:predicted ATPase
MSDRKAALPPNDAIAPIAADGSLCGLRLFRHRQVLRGQRATQGAGAARSFATGKFDQYKRDIPYATLVRAFQSLVRRLLGKSEAELQIWRERLQQALDPDGSLIIDLVPELKLIIGAQPPVPDLPPQDAKNRFQLVFRRFIQVFARPEHPLALPCNRAARNRLA